jgi:Yip1 domain
MSRKSANTGSNRPNVGIRTTLHHALALDANFYDDADRNPHNRRLALLVVSLAAFSHGMGSAVILLINQASIPFLLLGTVLNWLIIIVGYYLWTLAIWKIGQWLKPIDPTYGDLLSPIGFAYAPQVLNFLTLIPLMGPPIGLVLAVWSLLAVVVAIREGLDITTRQAVTICLLFWIPLQIAIGVLQVLLH